MARGGARRIAHRASSASLVANGLVLIFKASGVFNFAQGAMVLFAALTLVRLMEKMPFALAIAATLAIKFALAWAIERWVLRPLVNQDGIVLFMATLGVAYFLDGFGQAIWGSEIYTLNVGMPKEPAIILQGTFEGGVLLDMEDLVAAGIAATLVVALMLFFQKTGTGRALRAVADDHQRRAIGRHPAEPHLGDRVERRGLGGAGRGGRVGPGSSACSSRSRRWR